METTTRQSALSARSVFSILAGVLLVAWFGPRIAFYGGGDGFTAGTLPAALLLVLVLFRLVGVGLRRLGSRFELLSPRELLFVFAVLLPVSVVVVESLAAGVYTVPVGIVRGATRENRWMETFLQTIPDSLVPSKNPGDPILLDFHRGGAAVPWSRWIGPLWRWSLLFAGGAGAVFFLALLIARQWVTNERLSFPLMQIPGALAGESEAAGKSPVSGALFWVTLAFVLLLQTLQPLNLPAFAQRLPFLRGISVPAVNLTKTLGAAFSNKPWNILNAISFRFDFFAIGVGYFLTLQTSFSLWFTYLLVAFAVPIAGTAFGYTFEGSGPNLRFADYAGAGAGLVFLGFTAAMMRGHIVESFRAAFAGGEEREEGDRAFYRLCWIGFPLSAAAYLALAVRFGVTLSLAAAILCVGILGVLLVARVVSEMGLAPGMAANGITTAQWFVGGSLGSAQSASVAHLLRYFGMMPTATSFGANVLQGSYLRSETGVRASKYALVVLLALLVAVPVTHGSALSALYGRGAGSSNNSWLSSELAIHYVNDTVRAVTGKEAWKRSALGWSTAGGALSAVCMLLRQRFLWWPLHPIGLVVAETRGMWDMWFSLLIAWAVKGAAIRLAGPKGFRALLPAAYAMILGSVLGGGGWRLLDYLFNLGR